jgi:hypothetical protein
MSICVAGKKLRLLRQAAPALPEKAPPGRSYAQQQAAKTTLFAAGNATNV